MRNKMKWKNNENTMPNEKWENYFWHCLSTTYIVLDDARKSPVREKKKKTNMS